MRHEALATRRDFVKALTATGSGLLLWNLAGDARAADVPWLAEVTTPPKTYPPPREKLAPLLVDTDGRAIRSLNDWKQQRARLRDDWLKFLGPMPRKRPPVHLEVLKQDQPEGCVRQLVRYDAEAAQPVEGYLLRPADFTKAKRAGIVALHQTSRDNIDEIAGVKGPEVQHLGLQLARRGFVVFCPRCYLWQTPPEYKIDVRSTVAQFKKRHPHTLGMHKMLFDAMRAVDVLLSLSDVDSNRIGAAGHSLGAKEALYLAAFDDRVKAAVASEGGTAFTSTNWDDPWYLGKAINEPDFALNHHQLLALIAPRPFLILAGESGRGAADGDRSWPYVTSAQKVFRLYGQPARIGIHNHRQGHAIPPVAKQRLFDWLQTYLATS